MEDELPFKAPGVYCYIRKDSLFPLVYQALKYGESRGVQLYKTRFMLDELGNLQSEGHGISNFQTMLSIGLGQEQQFSATSCILKRYAV